MREWPTKIVGYNPLAARELDRRDDTFTEFQYFDLVLLAGTGVPCGNLNVAANESKVCAKTWSLGRWH